MRERILLIKDPGKDHEILEKNLGERGFDVLTAQSEQEFWKLIWSPGVELVIFDVRSKKRTEASVYQALLDFGSNQKIPIILKTGLTTQVRPAPVLYDENYVFFPFPVTFERLYSEIEHLLMRRKIVLAA